MKINARRLLATAGLAAFAAVSPVHAQPSGTVSDVPFAFTVGSTVLPRDTYSVVLLSGHNDAFAIKSVRHAAIVLSQPAGRDAADPTPRLVFHRYGDSYFLREVRLGGNAGFSLPKTRQEEDAAERTGSRSTAEVVIVHARQG